MLLRSFQSYQNLFNYVNEKIIEFCNQTNGIGIDLKNKEVHQFSINDLKSTYSLEKFNHYLFVFKNRDYYSDINFLLHAGIEVKNVENIEFSPKKIKLVPLGLKTVGDFTTLYKLYIRSSLPIKHKFMLANSVGIIEGSYRNEICAPLINMKTKKAILESGRVGQIIFPWNKMNKYITIFIDEEIFDEVDKLFPSVRSGGFGSTGK